MKQRIALLTLLAGGLFLSACNQPHSSEPEAVTASPKMVDTLQLSNDAVRNAGLQTVTVVTKSVNTPLRTVGNVNVNENQVFHISTFSAGRLVQDRVQLGDMVQAGQQLGAIQNLDLVKADAERIHQLHLNELEIRQAKIRWVLAQKNLVREKNLLAEGISPRKDYLQAETEAALAKSDLDGKLEHRVHLNQEAKALLGAYGVRPTDASSEKLQTLSPITTPHAGVVIKKNVTVGDMVNPDVPLYEVANLSQMWLDLTIYPKDLPSIHLGQSIVFQSDSLPGHSYNGRIDYIPPSASPQTQTFTARAYLHNPNGQLRPGMLGVAYIQQPGNKSMPFLPEAAVQTYGKETFVFRALGQGRYQKVTIRKEKTVPGGYLVNGPIRVGERIVSQGSFNLKAELLKSQFGEEE